MTLVYNNSNEEVPPFGVMLLDTGAEEVDGQIVLKVKKPDGEIRPSQYLFNGPVRIRPREVGNAQPAIAPCWALFDVGNTPAFDEDWGPKSGEWKLNKQGTGFQVLSNSPVRERIVVRLQIGPQLFMAQVDGAITAPELGSFNRINGEKGSETEITDDSVSAYDRFGDVDDNSKAIIGFIDGDWEQVVGECPA